MKRLRIILICQTSNTIYKSNLAVAQPTVKTHQELLIGVWCDLCQEMDNEEAMGKSQKIKIDGIDQHHNKRIP